ATRGIADIITIGGIINVDFADVRSVMSMSGEALMGCGIASGENRAIEAAQKAISSPLLEGVSIKGAKNILLNVTGSSSLTMHEIDEGNKVIYDAAGEEANIIFGWVNKEEMNEYVSYTVIATGFETGKRVKETPQAAKAQTPAPQAAAINFGSGYTASDQQEIKFPAAQAAQDLDEPTIFRVRGSRSLLSEEAQFPASGFSIDRFAQRNKVETKSKQQSDDQDDEEGSSFLRMMMD
ncbi:MAG: cell division protein FtsZ, partial [Syntrophothermus sp.]